MLKIRKFNQAGDTILEVLIAVAVLSLILTTSFTLANRSSQATRQAAERGEASKWAQSEIEELKYFLSTNLTGIPVFGYFCVNTPSAPSTNVPNIVDVPVINSNNINNPTIFNAIPAGCRQGTDQRYATFIYRDATTPNTYTVYVRWDSVTGRGTDKISLIHRIYPDTASNITAITGGGVPITPPIIPVTGEIRASADCFTGCPQMLATFYWSDGSNDTNSWTVNQLHVSGAGSYPYSFNKTSVVTLTKVTINMAFDAYGPLAGQDRNLYIHDYTVIGQGTFGFNSAVGSGCPHAPYYYTGADAKFHCTAVMVDYYPGMNASFGSSSLASCVGTQGIPPNACNVDPVSAPGYAPFALFNCSNYYTNYFFAKPGRILMISYGDNIGCSNGLTPDTATTGYKYHLNIYVGSDLRKSLDINVSAANLEGVIPIDLGSSVPVGYSIKVEWTNNQWLPGPCPPQCTYDPDFTIYRIGLAP